MEVAGWIQERKKERVDDRKNGSDLKQIYRKRNIIVEKKMKK